MSTADPRLGFLVAGVQKAGTSALFDYLREVPGLQLPASKELHFFDDEEGVDWSDPDYAPLHAHFKWDHRLCGEATPITLYWPNALERVRAYNPAMRLILIFRDPIERAWSQWQMEFARGKETEPFAWCIREGRRRMTDAMPYPGFHRVFSYVERGFYGRQLANAFRLFPRDQILVVGSADLARDPDATIVRICDFLSVTPTARPAVPRRVRTAPEIHYPSSLMPEDSTYLDRIYRSELARFVELAGLEPKAVRSILTAGGVSE